MDSPIWVHQQGLKAGIPLVNDSVLPVSYEVWCEPDPPTVILTIRSEVEPVRQVPISARSAMALGHAMINEAAQVTSRFRTIAMAHKAWVPPQMLATAKMEWQNMATDYGAAARWNEEWRNYIKAIWIGEVRNPKEGEWYLEDMVTARDGRLIPCPNSQAYVAFHDMANPRPIARVVRVRHVPVIAEES